MSHRLLSICIFIGWVVAMGWLVTTKIVPPMLTGQQPTYQTMLPNAAAHEMVEWEIRLNGEHVGIASNDIQRNPEGGGRVRTVVNLHEFSVDEIFGELTKGTRVLSFFSSNKQQPRFGDMHLKITSELQFDVFGELNRFHSNVSIDELVDFIQLNGIVNSQQLLLTVFTNNYGSGEPNKIYDNVMKIPPGTLMTDAFSPQPRLARLKVGQSWVFQRYQPLRPSNPIEMMEATVERRDAFDWNGESVVANVVAIRREASGSLTAGRQPIGYVWSLKDGTVVRQESMIGSMEVVFDRIAPSEGAEVTQEATP